MFYNNLEGTEGSFCGSDFTDGVTGETRSFDNLLPHAYWSGTEYASYPHSAWDFYFNFGYQVTDNKHYFGLYAWAVRPGDVSAPVPEPATMLLLGSGLAGLGIFRKKIRLRHK